MDDQGSMCVDVAAESMGVSTESTGLNRIMFLEICTKGMGVNGGTSMDFSMGKTVLRGITYMYD